MMKRVEDLEHECDLFNLPHVIIKTRQLNMPYSKYPDGFEVFNGKGAFLRFEPWILNQLIAFQKNTGDCLEVIIY